MMRHGLVVRERTARVCTLLLVNVNIRFLTGELLLTHISHLKRNYPDYNSARKASNEAISGFSMKISGGIQWVKEENGLCGLILMGNVGLNNFDPSDLIFSIFGRKCATVCHSSQ